MRLYADGIITNEFNQVLFIQRNDSRTWAPPGGAIEAGESPPLGLEREVEEETGLKVRAVRLVGLYYRHEKPDGLLLFSFRCIQRGGQIRTSKESPQVGFLPIVPLPNPMLGIHRERVQRALAHAGGPPYWGTQALPIHVRVLRWLLYQLVYGARDAVRALRGEPVYQPPPEWRVAAFVIVRDDDGKVLWVRRNDYDVWNLPGGGSEPMEPPWQTAVRETREETGLEVELTHLAGVYTKPEQGQIVCTFTAELRGGELVHNPEAAAFSYFAPGEEPPNSLPKHVERVADATGFRQTTIFKEQTGPSGVVELGLV